MKKFLKISFISVILTIALFFTSFNSFATQNTGESSTTVTGLINSEQPGVLSVAYTREVELTFKYQSTIPTNPGALNFTNNGTTPVNIYFKEAVMQENADTWKPTNVLYDSNASAVDWNTSETNQIGLSVKAVNGISNVSPIYGKQIASINPNLTVNTTFDTFIPRKLGETTFKRFGMKLNFIFESVYN